jgi:hypothetical protein
VVIIETIEHIALYANGILLACAKYFSFVSIFKRALNPLWVIISYIAFIVITTTVFFLLDSLWITVAVNVAAYIALTFLFSGNVGTKFIFAMLIYIIGVFAEGFSFLIISFIHYAQYSYVASIEEILLLGRSLASAIHLPLILMLTVFFRQYINRNAKYRHFKIPLQYTLVIFIMISGLILINVLFLSAAIGDIQSLAAQTIIAHIVSSVIILLVIWLYNTILNHLEEFQVNRKKDEILKRWELQYQAAVNSLNIVGRLQHNLNYHFLSLSIFLKEGNVGEAKSYVESKLSDLKPIIATGNITIDTMINYYHHRVKTELDIDLGTELFIPSNLKLDTNITVMILGNAMENALDACAYVEQNQRYIRIRAEIIEEHDLLLTITNPYVITPKINKNGNYETTKPDRATQGLGLASIKEVLPEDYGYIRLHHDDNTFQFMLLFYNVLSDNAD